MLYFLRLRVIVLSVRFGGAGSYRGEEGNSKESGGEEGGNIKGNGGDILVLPCEIP